MTISREFWDELLSGCERPEDLLGDSGLMKELSNQLMERMLGAELTAHLGHEEGNAPPPDQVNRRNGTAGNRQKSQDGLVPISLPRDRDGSFEPEFLKKGQPRIDGMDDRIVGLYAAGLTVRDIRTHLLEFYDLKVSPDLPFGHCAARPCRAMDQSRHQRRSGRGPRMAKPATGAVRVPSTSGLSRKQLAADLGVGCSTLSR